jgi:uncharacterized protein YbjT (DUF2867 family)
MTRLLLLHGSKIMKDLLLVGATGLVGQSVLRQALADSRVAKLIAVTRKPLPPQPRLENPLVDFDALPADAPWWQVDGGICTLGTTMRQAGSHIAFRKVDVEYPLTVARLLHQNGAQSFAFNSSIGANPKARAFYMRVKGEVEQRLIAGGFPSLTLVRPSGILGPRTPSRAWEARTIRMFHSIRPILPRHYRVVPADKIAKALLEAAINAPPGVHIVESERL